MIAELVIPERAILRAVVEGGAKYISAIKTHPPAERDAVAAAYFDIVAAVAKGEAPSQPLWGEPVHEELFDLAADPGERDERAQRRWRRGRDARPTALDPRSLRAALP